MRIILIHNPKAGRDNHSKKDLMAALAKAGHHAIYQLVILQPAGAQQKLV
jgi:diacylglycerol kinase family enzyme